MANEIKETTILECLNGSFQMAPRRVVLSNIAQAAIGSCEGTQTIGTTPELITLGNLTTPGMAQFTNTDATHYVEIGLLDTGTFYPVAKLLPGEPAQFRVGSGFARLAACANTAAVKLEKHILET